MTNEKIYPNCTGSNQPKRYKKSVMKTEVSYRFSSAQVANRFLHELKNWHVAQVSTRLFKGDDSVNVSYEYDQRGFDNTLSELDNLAEQYGGKEV